MIAITSTTLNAPDNIIRDDSAPSLDRNQHSQAVTAMKEMTLGGNSVAMLLSASVSVDSANEDVAVNTSMEEERVAIEITEDALEDAEIQGHVHTQSEQDLSAEHSHLQSYYQPSPPMFVHSLSIDRSSPSSLLLHQCYHQCPIPISLRTLSHSITPSILCLLHSISSYVRPYSSSNILLYSLTVSVHIHIHTISGDLAQFPAHQPQ